MILIRKEKADPAIVQNVHQVQKTVDWNSIAEGKDAKRARDAFDALDKGPIQKALFREQHGLCAYCMRRLPTEGKVRIEHIKPVSAFPQEALSYENWAGVCDGGETSKVEENLHRVLCCDAAKKESEISIDVYDSKQITKIRYHKDGRIYTYPEDSVMEHDINEVLRLNGIIENGKVKADTSTHLVQGRKAAFESCERRFSNKRKKLTSAQLYKEADALLQAEVYDEFVGVKVFFLRKKAKSLEAAGSTG